MNEAEQRFKSLGTETHRISFPIVAWEEFESECKENYNNTYWMKIMADHDYKKQMKPITELVITNIVTLENRVAELEELVGELKVCMAEDKKPSEQASIEPQLRRKTMGSSTE